MWMLPWRSRCPWESRKRVPAWHLDGALKIHAFANRLHFRTSLLITYMCITFRLIDMKIRPRFLLGFTNLLQLIITLSFPLVSTTPRAVAMVYSCAAIAVLQCCLQSNETFVQGICRGIYQGFNQTTRAAVIPCAHCQQPIIR